MKYLLMIYFNQATWDGLSEDQRQAVFSGHDKLGRTIRESGEFVDTAALGDPSQSSVVRTRDGVPAVTDGPYVESKEYLAGYYLVDCETRERANELAAMIPDAAFNAIEVRPLMHYEAADL